MYYGRSVSRSVAIGNQKVVVDSKLEERVLRHLEETGFQNLWLKPSKGVHLGKDNYTPDIELSVEIDGQTHLAVVEIKPTKPHFTQNQKRRMIGIAGHYKTDVLLLYTEKQDRWYRIDAKSGQLTEFGAPRPGAILIKDLYKPWTIPARPVYSHRYRQAAIPAIGNGILDTIVAILASPFVSPPKGRRRSHRRKHR